MAGAAGPLKNYRGRLAGPGGFSRFKSKPLLARSFSCPTRCRPHPRPPSAVSGETTDKEQVAPAQFDLAGELVLPCRLGEYELLEKLGEGGMGSVYRARHVRLGKPAALKLVRPDHARSREARVRFE